MSDARHIFEVDSDELACRILEAQVERRRPTGMTATEALEMQSDELRSDVRRAASAALFYIAGCIRTARLVQ